MPAAPELVEAVRTLRAAEPTLGLKALVARLRAEQPGLGAEAKLVREALGALEQQSKAATAPAGAPAVAEGGGTASQDVSLLCVGCGRHPSAEGRDKWPSCRYCVNLNLVTSYWCGENCPAGRGPWKQHVKWHEELKKRRESWEDGAGVMQRRNSEVAEEHARIAEETGSEHDKLLAEGTRCCAKEDWRKAAKAFRGAIALKPDEPEAYYNLGCVLSNSGYPVEAAQRFLEAKERSSEGSEMWVEATARAFHMLRLPACAEAATPPWWNDEDLKALSKRVVRAAPKDEVAQSMRAVVLSGNENAWESGLRSAAELEEAAEHFERSAELYPAPAIEAALSETAAWCRSVADKMKQKGVQRAIFK